MKAKGPRLPEELIEDIAKRFRTLGEPVRLRMLRLLQDGEMSVNDVAEALGAGQSNASRHLQALYDCGLAGRRREGNAILYFIDDPFVGRLCDLVCQDAVKQAHGKLRRIAKAGLAG